MLSFIMAKKGNSICAVCCQSFEKAKIKSKTAYNFRLQKLTRKFVTAEDSCNQLANCSGATSEDFINSPVVICSSCVLSLTGALDTKRQVISLEAEVSKIQMQLLKLLTNLQGKINFFKGQVNKVESLISESTHKVKNLDAAFEENNVKESQDPVGDISLKEVIQFRENILTVFEDLRDFNKQLGIKSSPINASPGKFQAASTMVPSLTVNNNDKEETAAISDDDHSFLEAGNENADHFDGDLSGNDDDLDNIPLESEDLGTASDESDTELESSNPKRRRKSSGERSASYNSTIDFTGMTLFKKAFLKRVLFKSNLLSSPDSQNPKKESEKSDSFDDIDPLKKHWIIYDSTTDTFTLSGFKITVNEDAQSLECSNCGYQSKNKKWCGAERLMYDHILGHHLKLFTCPICQTNVSTAKRFRVHVLAHRKDPLICDICGKPLKSMDVLKRHKWLHMSQVEKAEAVKSGEQAPGNQNEMRRAREKSFQCATCGKGFIFQAYLNRHEKCHLKERTHMCPQCGKLYKCVEDLKLHLKVVCFPGKGIPEKERSVLRYSCEHCPRKFPLPSRLKEHQMAYHSEQRSSFKCGLCGKVFKLRSLMSQHEKIHSDARPFSCKKGCGATFKTSSHLRRHEKKCQK